MGHPSIVIADAIIAARANGPVEAEQAMMNHLRELDLVEASTFQDLVNRMESVEDYDSREFCEAVVESVEGMDLPWENDFREMERRMDDLENRAEELENNEELALFLNRGFLGRLKWLATGK